MFVLADFFPVGVGDVCWDRGSSKSREDVWSGDEVVEGVVDRSPGVWRTSSVPTVRIDVACIGCGSEVSIAVGSGGVILSLSMALTWFVSRVLSRWHGLVLTEFLILVLPEFYCSGGRSAGECHAGCGRGFVFLGWCSGHGGCGRGENGDVEFLGFKERRLGQ